MHPGRKEEAMMPMQIIRRRGRRRVATHNEQSYPYFSHVRFQFTQTAGTWTYAQGTEVKAFNYAQGQALSGAGFPSAVAPTATALDTNLIKQSETVAGETVKIYGL